MGAAAAPVRIDARAALLGRLTAAADAALAELARAAPLGALAGCTGAGLLGERAAAGHRADGTCRLLEAADGWLAVNLARADDWSLLPAWLQHDVATQWDAVARAVRRQPVRRLVGRGRLLGLAVAADQPPRPAPWCRVRSYRGPPRSATGPHARTDFPASGRRPLVVDLSALWAGPLCGRLLLRLGAEVIKVESAARPDGARRGSPAFFERLNAGKTSVVLDFAAPAGRAALVELLRRADIVIEGSRPRALRQLGIVAEDVVRERGTTWVSISGYGRGQPQEDWIAYGDDAAVAAGLTRVLFEQTGERALVGDAVADPLTGIHAALAAWRAHRAGGGQLVSLALCDVVRHCLAHPERRIRAAGTASGVIRSYEARAPRRRRDCHQAEGGPP